ncbi:MAG TPA: 50S ribosomal protein L25 [bacterium]|nr:50S ribosomal protein L25 [bacterium]HPN44877.1 50S ribosomal protein L25 [bacterium]
MSQLSLTVETRKETGKQYAKKLKRDEKIPGVFYFHGKENIPLTVGLKDVQALVGNESGIVKVLLDGKHEKNCIIREIQYHPITARPIHIDLMGILMTEKIHVNVPVHLTGIANGVKNFSGILQHNTRELEVLCLPADIPQFIEVDVTNLGIGDSIHVSSIKMDKIEFLNDPDTVIASVGAMRVTEEPVAAAALTTEDAAKEPELITKAPQEEKKP